MKTLELQLKKKIFIIEEPVKVPKKIRQATWAGHNIILKDSNLKLICKGDELTEEICETLISKKDVAKNQSKMCGLKFKEGFINMIKDIGYYWGENPLGDYSNAIKRHIVTGTWQEHQDKTFDLNHTFIFKVFQI